MWRSKEELLHNDLWQMWHFTLFKFSVILILVAEESCDEIVWYSFLNLKSEFLVDFNQFIECSSYNRHNIIDQNFHQITISPVLLFKRDSI